MVRTRVILADVAARAGVSRTTASFVMSGRRDMRISAAAEERVLRAARELDYRPNLMARGLRDNLSQSIGLISDVVATEPFAGQVIRGSLATALLHGHLLFVGETGGDALLEKRLIGEMVDRGVAGIIYASNDTRRVKVSALLEDKPMVLLNCFGVKGKAPSVIPDDRNAGRVAAAALLDAGHSDAIYLVGEAPNSVIAGRDRLAGIQETLAGRGFALAGTADCLWWPQSAYEATAALLASPARPSALICMNDRVAFGAYQALAEAGLAIPRDVSVVAFDDSDLASWLRPGLSSVVLPHFELGRRAVELLLDDDRENVIHRVSMELRERDSVGPPASRSRIARRRSLG